MKEIKLTRGFVTQVDDEDFEYLNQWKWYTVIDRNNHYARRGTFINGRKGHESMHRLIMKTPPTLQVDHIDHDGLNNQKYNLRNCTQGENQRNKRPSSKTGYLNIRPARKRLRVDLILRNGAKTYIGTYDTIEEAIIGRDNAKLLHCI